VHKKPFFVFLNDFYRIFLKQKQKLSPHARLFIKLQISGKNLN